jgi:hypothetical protein
MRNRDQPVATDRALQELEAALSGELTGPAADSWRTLREDVRSLPSPIDPGFRKSLRARLESTPSTTAQTTSRRAARNPFRNPRLAGGLIASLAAIAVAIVIVAPFSRGSHPGSITPMDGRGISRSPTSSSAAAEMKAAGISAPKADEAPVPSSALASPAGSPGRIQELGASISLASTPSQIQLVADGVSRLAASVGGYVQSSHVEVAGKSSEASIELSVPSAKLTRTLTTLGRLAPVRAESQSLQDVTGAYAAVKRRLADVVAERAALLRTLARASTRGEVESLRRRLSLAGGAVTRAQTALAALSRRASNSSIEVTVLADGSVASEGLTLHRGLHDAGRVLSVALIGLLIGLAALVPVLLTLAVAIAAFRRGRRVMRERTLL